MQRVETIVRRFGNWARVLSRFSATRRAGLVALFVSSSAALGCGVANDAFVDEEQLSDVSAPTVTTSADASADGQYEGKTVILTSWYYRGPGVNKGVRVSFVDYANPSAPRYRHVLLVEPYTDAPGNPNFRTVPVHAGGIVWYGHYLYVADTWNQRIQIRSKRAAMVSVLREAHPQVQAVVDAPTQMRRETELLRTSAGRAGDSDLEVLMQAAASAWPEQRPVQNLRFENGALTLAAPGWNDPEISQFRETLRPSGWLVEAADGRLTLKRGTQASR